MICKKCGSELKDGTKFCTVCGANITEEIQTDTEEKVKTYCKKCDAPILEGMETCPICLTPVKENIPQSPNPNRPTIQPNAVQRTFSVKPGKGGGWIVFAKILLWLLFAGIILIGISSGIMLIFTGLSSTGSVNVPEEYYYYYGAMRVEPMLAVISGITVIIISIILAFVTVCSGFLAIDACLNLKNMNDNLSELIKISAETGNTSEKINAAILEIMKRK